jgi:hypothetical protein
MTYEYCLMVDEAGYVFMKVEFGRVTLEEFLFSPPVPKTVEILQTMPREK